MTNQIRTITNTALALALAIILEVPANAQAPVLPLSLNNSRIPMLKSALLESKKSTLAEQLKILQTGKFEQQSQAAKAILSIIPKLSTRATVVSLLAVGRFYAGQSSNGKQLKNSDQSYRQYLVKASKKTTRYSEAERDAVFRFILATYRKAEPNNSWTTSPLSQRAFRDLPAYQAFVERQALEHWHKDRRTKSIITYRRIAKKLTGKKQRSSIDRRYAYLSEKNYQKDGNITRHEKRLRILLSNYKDNQVFGAKNESLVISNKKRVLYYYERLAKKEIAAAEKKSSSSKHRLEVIPLVKRLISNLNDDKVKIRHYKEKLAKIYQVNEQHSRAVATYQSLIPGASLIKKSLYLKYAIKSQSILASWPQMVVWSSHKRIKKSQRALLRDLHNQRANLTSSEIKWRHSAHSGLISINLGDGKTAFSQWNNQLSENNITRTANEIAGFMAHTYKAQKSWGELEKISRLAKQKRFKFIFNKTGTSPKDMLALSLIEGGNQHLKTGQYSTAREKLLEFTSKFSRHKRYEEGLYHLALAQRGEGLHADSIKSLITILRDRPSSKYASRSALKCSEWSETIALEEELIYCGQTYLKLSKNRGIKNKVRESLARIYIGRELHGQASYQLKMLARDTKLQRSKRIKFALKALEIEERYGSSVAAFEAAKLAESISKGNHDVKARALVVKARYFFETNRASKLERVISQVEKLNTDSKAVRESLAESRFYSAQLMAATKRPEIYSIELKNPSLVLEREFNHYKKIRDKYLSICEIGPNSYCGPAQISVTSIADDTLDRIEDISIADKLSKSLVDQFNSRKMKISDIIASDHQNFGEKALETVNNHHTSPNWTLQILWENSTDWNFDRITGETSNGFIQFDPQLVTVEK